MIPTPIKINKTPANQSETSKPIRHALNLNGSPAKIKANGLKKYLWLLLLLAIAQATALTWLYLQKPISPYQKLLPANNAFSAYLNQQTLINLVKLQLSNNINWPPLAWSEAALKSFLTQAKIERAEELLALFSDQMAIAVLPQEANDQATWLLLASLKAPNNVFSQARDQAERGFKQNFNLTNELYRQVKISQVQPLTQGNNSLFYAAASDYFILANNNRLVKETIDKIVK